MNTITIPRKALLEACKLFRALIPRKSIVPILSAVLIEVTPNQLTLSGTDLESHIVLKLDGEHTGDDVPMSCRSVIPFHPL